MNSYNEYMNNDYSKHKYQSYEDDKPQRKTRFEIDETIGIFKDDNIKPNKPLIAKDTSELTKAFFSKRNEQQQEQRDEKLEQAIFSNSQSPRQFKNNM